MPSYQEMLAARLGIIPQTPMDPELAMAQAEGVPGLFKAPPSLAPMSMAQAPMSMAQVPTRKPAAQPEIVPAGPQNIQDSDSEYKRMMAAVQHEEGLNRKRLEEYLNRTKGGMGQLQEMFKAQLGQPVQTDISSLLALSDSLSPGGKLLSGYQRPPSQQELSQQGLSNMLALQQRQEALAGLAKAPSGSETQMQKLMMALKKDEGTQGRFEERQTLQKEDTIRKDLDKSVLTPISARTEQFANIDDALASGEYQKIWANVAQMSRGISGEKGVLTDYDIQRIMPKNIYGDVSRIKAYFSETPSDKMDPAYVEKLRELVQTAKTNSAKIYGDLLTGKENVYSKSNTYKPLFQEGGSGRNMFNETRESIKRFTGEPQAPGGLKVGDVEGGYKYLGGDPADQKSWKKQ